MFCLGVVAGANIKTQSISKAAVTTPVASAPKPLIYLTGSDLVDMDPQIEYDTASADVFNQVCETLFTNNLTDPNLGVIPRLATGYVWSNNATQLTINLHTGITFSDGTPFNKTTVVWNFERIFWLFNWTSEYPTYMSWMPAPFDTINNKQVSKFEYLLDSGTMPMVDKIWANAANESVTMDLTGPLASLPAVLGWSGFCMIAQHNSYAVTPLNGTTNQFPIGTGPYVLTSRTPTERIQFDANPSYWRGVANITTLIYNIIKDSQTRTTAMYNLEGSILDAPVAAMIPLLQASTSLKVDVSTTLTTAYIGMNNLDINRTWRQAISFCFDYNYFLTQIEQGYASRMQGPLVPGLPYYNGSLSYPTMNITLARQILINAKIVPAGLRAAAQSNLHNDAWWQNLAATSPIRTFNYSYNVESLARTQTGTLMKSDLALIGCGCTLNGLDWVTYVTEIYDVTQDKKFGLFMIGWAPDYVDPDDYTSPLLATGSSSNDALVSDSSLDLKMAAARVETNTTLRAQDYSWIQNYTANYLYPWLFLSVAQWHIVHTVDLKGFPGNAMNIVYFYPCYFQSVSGYHFATANYITSYKGNGTAGTFNYTTGNGVCIVSTPGTSAILISGFWNSDPIGLAPGLLNDAHDMFFFVSGTATITGGVDIIFQLTPQLYADVAASQYPAQSIACYTFDTGSNTWIDTGFTITLLGSDNVVLIHLDHFSAFALGMQTYTPPPAPISTPGYDLMVFLSMIGLVGIAYAVKVRKSVNV